MKKSKILPPMNKLLKNDDAQVGTLYMVFFAAIIVLAIIIIFTFIPGIGSIVEQSTPAPPAYGHPGGDWNATATDVQASGTFTFTGNVSNGDVVNITSGSSVYHLEFNTTAHSTIVCVTANCIAVNLTGLAGQVFQEGYRAPQNLTNAINNNASLAALVTAVNGSNVSTLTAVTTGTLGNNIVLSDNSAKVTSSGLSGGTDGNPNAAALRKASGANIWASTSGILLVAIIIGIVVIILAALFGIFRNRNQPRGGAGGGM